MISAAKYQIRGEGLYRRPTLCPRIFEELDELRTACCIVCGVTCPRAFPLFRLGPCFAIAHGASGGMIVARTNSHRAGRSGGSISCITGCAEVAVPLARGARNRLVRAGREGRRRMMSCVLCRIAPVGHDDRELGDRPPPVRSAQLRTSASVERGGGQASARPRTAEHSSRMIPRPSPKSGCLVLWGRGFLLASSDASRRSLLAVESS